MRHAVPGKARIFVQVAKRRRNAFYQRCEPCLAVSLSMWVSGHGTDPYIR